MMRPSLIVATLVAVALPAIAAAQVMPRLSQDSKQPIEISADKLEVQQQQRLAIFSGNVDARQGEIRLRADTLRVHYADNTPGQRNSEAQSISRIDAVGNVFFSSQKETAQGEQGVYDVDRGTVTMSGAVVLTSGESVIRGTRLVMNLNTGTSTMDEAPTASGKPGRVRGLFVPSQAPAPAQQPAPRR